MFNSEFGVQFPLFEKNEVDKGLVRPEEQFKKRPKKKDPIDNLNEYIKEDPDLLERELLYGIEENLTEEDLMGVERLLETNQGRATILREFVKEKEAKQIIQWIEEHDKLIQETIKIDIFLEKNQKVQNFIRDNMNWAQSYFDLKKSAWVLRDIDNYSDYSDYREDSNWTSDNVLKIESKFLKPWRGLVSLRMSTQEKFLFSLDIALKEIEEERKKLESVSSSKTIEEIKKILELIDKIEMTKPHITSERVQELYNKGLSFSKIRETILGVNFSKPEKTFITRMITFYKIKKRGNRDEIVRICGSLDGRIRDFINNPKRVRFGEKRIYLEKFMGPNEKCEMCGIINEEHRSSYGERLSVHHKEYNWEEPLEYTIILCRKCHKKVHDKENEGGSRIEQEAKKMDKNFRATIEG